MRFIATALLALALSTGASAQTADVVCHLYTHSDGLVQLDCVGAPLAEVYEQLVQPWQVYDALRPMMSEWKTNVVWED